MSRQILSLNKLFVKEYGGKWGVFFVYSQSFAVLLSLIYYAMDKI